MAGLIELSKESFDLSVKKESLILALIYLILSGILATVIIAALLATVFASLTAGNPYANPMDYVFLLGKTMIICIIVALVFSPFLSIIIVNGASQARKGKLELNEFIPAIKKRFFPVLGIELITSILSIAGIGIVLLPSIIMGLNGLIYSLLLLPLLLLVWLLLYPFMLLMGIIVVIENNSTIQTLKKTISITLKNYALNIKAVLWFMALSMIFVIVTIILSLIPLIGAIATFPLSMWFAIYSIHYTIGLYELNQK